MRLFRMKSLSFLLVYMLALPVNPMLVHAGDGGADALANIKTQAEVLLQAAIVQDAVARGKTYGDEVMIGTPVTLVGITMLVGTAAYWSVLRPKYTMLPRISVVVLDGGMISVTLSGVAAISYGIWYSSFSPPSPTTHYPLGFQLVLDDPAVFISELRPDLSPEERRAIVDNFLSIPPTHISARIAALFPESSGERSNALQGYFDVLSQYEATLSNRRSESTGHLINNESQEVQENGQTPPQERADDTEASITKEDLNAVHLILDEMEDVLESTEHYITTHYPEAQDTQSAEDEDMDVIKQVSSRLKEALEDLRQDFYTQVTLWEIESGEQYTPPPHTRD